jgi:GMP synthase-like glutamine amidotransferase
MSLAILETGAPPGDLAATYGDYPAMFRALLGREARSYDVEAGELPAEPAAHDAYLITGSPAGVYEDLPWIAPLADFIRAAKSRKMVGICFGHQIMAAALGGHVEKSAKGWGAGLHTYPITSHEPWMDDIPAVSAPASHQDQVVIQPPNSDVIASSIFTPYAGLVWRDRPAISFQFHPEFSPAFAKALIEQRYDRVPDPAAAIASLDAPNDNARVGAWINGFLNAPRPL